MQILNSDPGLSVFQIIVLTVVALFLVSMIVVLLNKQLDSNEKIIWLIGILFLPIIGPILFFISSKKRKG